MKTYKNWGISKHAYFTVELKCYRETNWLTSCYFFFTGKKFHLTFTASSLKLKIIAKIIHMFWNFSILETQRKDQRFPWPKIGYFFIKKSNFVHKFTKVISFDCQCTIAYESSLTNLRVEYFCKVIPDYFRLRGN